ncbi:conserved hypothetical protein [Nostocoides australiense Ben110]|uniref:Uncharacterized protein n=1 Tax=Nostocoides australiense Ben110 TaxID=1193182 RepID=W6K432_9MICO|nr:hypothetical protein [Tetrasphaera australiensis]CCH74309.1 conserved hypothetical protein [Tetrasphaera australiensis Ben110]
MTTLHELLDPSRRPQTVDALVGVVDAEVKSKSGLSGAAIKTGYAAANKIDAKIVRRAINGMLPDFMAQLEPFWAARGEQPFGAYLAGNADAVSEALLAVTDARAANPKHAAIAKVYSKLRGKAKDNVEAALPRLGEALQSLAG